MDISTLSKKLTPQATQQLTPDPAKDLELQALWRKQAVARTPPKFNQKVADVPAWD